MAGCYLAIEHARAVGLIAQNGVATLGVAAIMLVGLNEILNILAAA
eukprot:CAMPEP_0172531934 /NCGR_PEP_ID=MMETSP1067-20121228/5157_1 /TAXON_ID=265564 ORGANISM="Thalassiosira punctigera, Strain Tpunct2005C2" /NCGR_SAMPLE_ID=MMETSP1067 /ASSEMBLY_ACC=CAM_ASM_000444 /LENGTH=45 /DNA_ID= /DNA_START= /DNA_END= /DNA_ORIENTATION=